MKHGRGSGARFGEDAHFAGVRVHFLLHGRFDYGMNLHAMFALLHLASLGIPGFERDLAMGVQSTANNRE